jgi:hypothetical protein
MDNLQELDEALRSDLNISSTSSLFPEATRFLALNRSYVKCSRLLRWPKLQDAKKTSTQANIDYYDAPENWTPMCIFRLEVDNEQYGEDPDGNPMEFNDFQIWKNENIGSDEKKWSIFYPYYFIYPIPTVAGSNNITIWGQNNVDKLVNLTDETIFSHSLPECNEAIVLEASGMLKRKGETTDKSGEMVSNEAKQILIVSFNKIKQDMAKVEKTQPFFNVPDFFARGNTGDKIGRF